MFPQFPSYMDFFYSIEYTASLLSWHVTFFLYVYTIVWVVPWLSSIHSLDLPFGDCQWNLVNVYPPEFAIHLVNTKSYPCIYSNTVATWWRQLSRWQVPRLVFWHQIPWLSAQGSGIPPWFPYLTSQSWILPPPYGSPFTHALIHLSICLRHHYMHLHRSGPWCFECTLCGHHDCLYEMGGPHVTKYQGPLEWTKVQPCMGQSVQQRGERGRPDGWWVCYVCLVEGVAQLGHECPRRRGGNGPPQIRWGVCIDRYQHSGSVCPDGCE
jgi:hypothetical protein